MIAPGYCQCGCGEKVGLSKRTDRALGLIRGQPNKFLYLHGTRGANNGVWKGGRTLRKDGYAARLAPGHPRASNSGYVLEHILFAETALGRRVRTCCRLRRADR